MERYEHIRGYKRLSASGIQEFAALSIRAGATT